MFFNVLLEVSAGADGEAIQGGDFTLGESRTGTSGNTLVLVLVEDLLELGVGAPGGAEGATVTFGVGGVT